MKKILAALLAASMTFALYSCALPWEDSSSESGSDSSSASDSESAESGDQSSKEKKKVKKGNFEGTGYTLDIDEKKWENITDTIQQVDAAFRYIGNEEDKNLSTSNFNVMVTKGAGSTKPEDYVEVVKNQYSSLGYTILGSSAEDFNGYSAQVMNVEMTQNDLTMELKQVIMVEDDTLFVISYGSEKSVFEEISPEFDTVLSTFGIL
ncbi:MAG: LpqN/LpqT family lipoprotein [Ruminococcus sp.]|nr:LpqN/LpqT family lipoprotein [Ruminococcus sp.]